ncbi:MAG: sodium-dependent bicarbonate transport family permease [bacterium]
MFILILLVGSFMTGVLLQLVFTHFRGHKSEESTSGKKYHYLRNKLHVLVVIYLLVNIGLIGGAEVAHEGLSSLGIPIILCLGLAMTLLGATLLSLNCIGITDREMKISLAVHFGSVSVGTFAAVQAFLNSRGIPFSPSTSAWLALMETPSIIVGAVLLGGGISAIKEVLTDRDILILLGTLALGFILGTEIVHKLNFILVEPFEWILAYFLFDMGQHAGEHIGHLREYGMKLVYFGIFTALFGGILGCLSGTLVGMSVGNTTILGTLTASASYVAATAVMSKFVSKKAIAITLTVSLGIVLTWNILLGIQIYTLMAKTLHTIQDNRYLVGMLLLGWLTTVFGCLVMWTRRLATARGTSSSSGAFSKGTIV